MKLRTILTALCFIAFIQWSQATILTVSNNAGVPAQYTDAQTAHNAANVGDTLFVHASGITYGSINISKKITIIGEGYYGASQTKFDNIYFTNNAATGGSIQSIYIDSYINTTTGVQADNITIERVYLDGLGFSNSEYTVIQVNGDNWIIRHCIQYSSELCRAQSGQNDGWIIANNYIHDYDAGSYTEYTIQDLNGAIIENNIIAASDNAIDDCTNTIIKNNIFYNIDDIDNEDNSSNIFDNNMSNNSATFTPNPGTGNITNTNPSFVAALFAPSLNGLSTLNLNLQTSSPAKGTGQGGTDMGIHGGVLPMPNHLPYDGKAAKPNIENLLILNPVVGQGQYLKFQIEAKTRD
ncbi:MAG: hypothetical protein GY810_15705 [Aureispira sp.]|nr:hypothetical protein [Aureispira sp.]